MKSQHPISNSLATASPWDICSISRAQWFKLNRSARTPKAIYLGTRRPVWLIAELNDWLLSGAPDLPTWERLKREGKE